MSASLVIAQEGGLGSEGAAGTAVVSELLAGGFGSGGLGAGSKMPSNICDVRVRSAEPRRTRSSGDSSVLSARVPTRVGARASDHTSARPTGAALLHTTPIAAPHRIP